jgi:hypothetical protein
MPAGAQRRQGGGAENLSRVFIRVPTSKKAGRKYSLLIIEFE